MLNRLLYRMTSSGGTLIFTYCRPLVVVSRTSARVNSVPLVEVWKCEAVHSHFEDGHATVFMTSHVHLSLDP
jgi:hypothetical protein